MKTKPVIKAVIFDLGNVLLNYNARKAAMRFSKECRVPITRLWKHFFVSRIEKAYTKGQVSSREFYEHAKKALGFGVNYPMFCHYWNDIFSEAPGMKALLEDLKRRYPLYLISNTNKLHFDYIKRTYRVLKPFKRCFPSHEVGSRKPGPKIYRHVLREIDFRAEETVFIDDTPRFVQGAKHVGMHAIRFKGKKKLIRDLKKLGIQVGVK